MLGPLILSVLLLGAVNGGEEGRKPTVYVYAPPASIDLVLDLSDNRRRGDYTEFLEVELLHGLLARKALRFITSKGDSSLPLRELFPHVEACDEATVLVEADYFWVPHALASRSIQPAVDGRGQNEYYSLVLRPWLTFIRDSLPYWKRRQGRDHILVYASDNGPVCDYCGIYPYLTYLCVTDPVWVQVVHPMIHVGYHAMQPGSESERKLFRHALSALNVSSEQNATTRRGCWAPKHGR